MSDQLGDGPEHGRPCSIELSPPVSADATAGDGSHPTGDFKRTRLTIAYRDVSLTVPVPVEDEGIHTVISPFVDALKTMTFCGSNLRTREFARVDSISGVLRPSSMTLILAPPGHGKSTFLKVLSSRLPATAGTILYNGLTSQEAAAEGCNTRRLTQYVDQIDEHLPLLTVTETLEFAHRVTCANYDAERVENTVKMLGLEECKDTILGDAIIRGVSGGQKRRVTLGEMLVGDACALFLDEYTNGLDTATSEDITRGLRRWTEQTNGLIVASLQQPTPGLFALFDRVVVLKDSQVVYDGPREDVELYFASMGFNCPEDVDICDFVIDCVSQPRVAFERLQANERRAARGHGGLASAMSGVTIMDPGGPSAATTPAAAFATSVGTLRRAAAPCVTTAQMAAHFKASPMWRETERQLGDIIPAAAGSSPGVPTAVSAVAAAPREPLMPSPETVDMYKVGYTLPLLTLFSVVFGRQWTNLKRNRGIVIPRLAQAMIMGLIFGSLYWQIPTDAFSLRIASLLVSQSEIGFGSMSELASSVDANHIVYKQAGASFYPTYMYVLSAAVCGLPTIFFETAFLSAFYFMSGATYEAGPFLTFYALIISSTWMIGIWFRMMSAIGDDEATAHAISGPSTGFFVLFGGFFVSMSNLPVWMRWIMWYVFTTSAAHGPTMCKKTICNGKTIK